MNRTMDTQLASDRASPSVPVILNRRFELTESDSILTVTAYLLSAFCLCHVLAFKKTFLARSFTRKLLLSSVAYQD